MNEEEKMYRFFRMWMIIFGITGYILMIINLGI